MANELQLQRLFEQIKDLSPADQLRLAAELLEKGKGRLAESIVARVFDEMRVMRVLDPKAFRED